MKKDKAVFGSYRILDEIAEGGFGKTYLAEHITLGTKACIKHSHEVTPEDEKVLLEEAKLIWDLRHHGIPAMRDIIRMPDKSVALVMSYIPGKTLAQIVDTLGGLDPEHSAWICERVLNILKYLHFHGVVHGDVKPQNIIVQPESHTVVLVDYGLSLLRPGKNSINKGYTPMFAAPEQIKGDTPLPETDFYTLGLTLIYALGGDVEAKKVPADTPKPICDFLKKLIVFEVLSRPHWGKEDLMASLQEARLQAFGRKFSNMKPLKI